MINVSTSEPTRLLQNTWKNMSKMQKKQLLRTRGLDESWAETKSINEMVNRGGGFIARDLLHVVSEYGKRNPRVNVRFK